MAAKLRKKPSISAVRPAKRSTPLYEDLVLVDGVVFELVNLSYARVDEATTPTDVSPPGIPCYASGSPQEVLELYDDATQRQKLILLRNKRRADSHSTSMGRTGVSQETGRSASETMETFTTPPSSAEGYEPDCEDRLAADTDHELSEAALSERSSLRRAQSTSPRPPTPVIMRKPSPSRLMPSPAPQDSFMSRQSTFQIIKGSSPPCAIPQNGHQALVAHSSTCLKSHALASFLELRDPLTALRGAVRSADDNQLRAEKAARVAKWAETQ